LVAQTEREKEGRKTKGRALSVAPRGEKKEGNKSTTGVKIKLIAPIATRESEGEGGKKKGGEICDWRRGGSIPNFRLKDRGKKRKFFWGGGGGRV